ncbi:MAG: hypothetical protein WB729_18705 [Candidatus Sulfotelmatobacter sp.]
MGFENVPRCQHIKINGTQCKCPALRRRRLCYFHRRFLEQRARIAADQFAQRPFETPVLEDANSVQMALMQVMQMIAMRRIERKDAGMLLYALQTAAVNMRATKFETYKATDVVIDRSTVRWTQIDGPQWAEEDFEQEEELEDNEQDGDDVDHESEREGEGETETAEAKDKDRDRDRDKDAESPAAAVPPPKKPPQSAPAPSFQLPLAREGESALETLKRIMAATEKYPRSG